MGKGEKDLFGDFGVPGGESESGRAIMVSRPQSPNQW